MRDAPTALVFVPDRRRRVPGRPEAIFRQIRAELRRLVRRAGSVAGSDGRDRRPAALRVFESLDRDGTGRLSRKKFRRALADLGFDGIGAEEAAEVLDRFDPRRHVLASAIPTRRNPTRSMVPSPRVAGVRG